MLPCTGFSYFPNLSLSGRWLYYISYPHSVDCHSVDFDERDSFYCVLLNKASSSMYCYLIYSLVSSNFMHKAHRHHKEGCIGMGPTLVDWKEVVEGRFLSDSRGRIDRIWPGYVGINPHEMVPFLTEEAYVGVCHLGEISKGSSGNERSCLLAWRYCFLLRMIQVYHI